MRHGKQTQNYPFSVKQMSPCCQSMLKTTSSLFKRTATSQALAIS
jgi:hypothetical protein